MIFFLYLCLCVTFCNAYDYENYNWDDYWSTVNQSSFHEERHFTEITSPAPVQVTELSTTKENGETSKVNARSRRVTQSYTAQRQIAVITPRTVNLPSVKPRLITLASVKPRLVTPPSVTSRRVTPQSVTPRWVTSRSVTPRSGTTPSDTSSSVKSHSQVTPQHRFHSSRITSRSSKRSPRITTGSISPISTRASLSSNRQPSVSRPYFPTPRPHSSSTRPRSFTSNRPFATPRPQPVTSHRPFATLRPYSSSSRQTSSTVNSLESSSQMLKSEPQKKNKKCVTSTQATYLASATGLLIFFAFVVAVILYRKINKARITPTS